LVWTPCVGPIMASVISLALTQRVDGGAIFITLAYSLGTSIPMLGVMLGGRALINRVPVLTKNLARIQKGFGVLMIAVAVMIAVGWDRKLQTAILRVFPSYGSGLTALENTDPVQGALEAREVTRPDQPGSGLSMVDVSGGAPETFSPSPRPRDGRLADYGPAPQIVTRGRWYNTEDVQTGGAGDESAKTGSAGAGDAEAEGSGSGENPAEGSPPLSMEELRGKVVIVDFWTYSCVNCVRTIPYLKSWYDEYRARGLVIIGVHTPEFEFEKNPSNVARAVSDLGIDWPVVLDNDYRQWRAYSNRYWPAHYFIDAEGRVRYFHFGEGEYDTSEKVIRALLKEAGEKVRGRVSNPDFQYYAHTPETYLGYGRSEGFTSAVDLVADRMTDYRPGGTPDNAEWSLAGTWAVKREYVVPESEGVLAIGFNAKNVFLVVEPEEPGGEIRVKVDGSVGSDTPDVKDGILMPDESRLYQLVGLEEPGEHVLSLEVKGKLRLFAFTFG
jgi:thiol-disulfide isomerase/thioredoxin